MSSAGHANVIFDKIEVSEETTSVSDAAESSTSNYDKAIGTTKVTEDPQYAPNSTTAETTPEPCIEWNAEDTDIEEPPVYMLDGIEVDNDYGRQVSGEYLLSPCHLYAHPRPQSTVATVVFKTATALGLTPVWDTKPPLS